MQLNIQAGSAACSYLYGLRMLYETYCAHLQLVPARRHIGQFIYAGCICYRAGFKIRKANAGKGYGLTIRQHSAF